MTDPIAARSAALAAFNSYAVHPTSLVSYVSHGRLLLVGTRASVEAVLERLPTTLSPSLLLSDAATPNLTTRQLPLRLGSEPCPERSREGQACWEYVSKPTLQGWLGAFHVDELPDKFAGSGFAKRTPEGGGLRTARHEFDLVLDLGQPPLLTLPVLPPGYFAPQGDAQRLDDALAQLADLVGEFDKPKYFTYRPDICAHHTAAVQGCQACLAVCGAAAIQSGDGRVTVIPPLCQGCGDCTTACPSGALGYAYPCLSDTLERMRGMLSAWRQADSTPPILLLYSPVGATNSPRPERPQGELVAPTGVLPYPLEALGAAGMEVWLSVLAYGAAAVWLLDDGGLSGLTRENLERQLGYARALLQAMGYGAECLCVVDMAAITHHVATKACPSRLRSGQGSEPGRRAVPTHASHTGQNDKRTALRLALEHLYRHAPQQAESVPLADGAPYGQILVDTQRCTLCLACVSVCPAGALQDGRDQPLLKFIEANCVQCGRCANACPENAVALQPRYWFDTQQARQPRLLHQADVFLCVECGKPFASAAMIKTITEKLKHHSMFQGEAARRLRLCEDCRVNAHFCNL